MAMKVVTAYQSTKDEDKFMFVPYGTDVETIKIPLDADDDYTEVGYYKTFELFSKKKLVGFDADLWDQIEEDGYSLQFYRPTITEQFFDMPVFTFSRGPHFG